LTKVLAGSKRLTDLRL